MKFYINILLSLVFTTAILLGLFLSGVVEFKGAEENSSLTIVKPVPERKSEPFTRLPANVTGSGMGNPVNIPATLETEVLKFFQKKNYDDVMNLEEEIMIFLTQKHGADQKTVDQMLRKCFWKSFYTLQVPLNHYDDAEIFEAHYQMEKKLKLAGFHAMGLSLMDEEISRSDNEFQRRYNKLTQEKMEINAL